MFDSLIKTELRLEVGEFGFETVKYPYDFIYWSQPGNHYKVYYAVFDYRFWIFILLFVVISSLFLLLLLIYDRHDQWLTNHDHWSFLTLSLKSCAGQSTDIPALKKRRSLQVLVFTLALSGFVIFSAYTGSLTSVFAMEDDYQPIHSLVDLSQETKFIIFTVTGFAVSQQLKSRTKDLGIPHVAKTNVKLFKNLNELFNEFVTTSDKFHIGYIGDFKELRSWLSIHGKLFYSSSGFITT